MGRFRSSQILVALAFSLALASTAAAKGTFVYLHDSETDQVHAYQLGKKGELTPLAGSPFAGPGGGGGCGGQCQTLAYDKRRKALFASSPAGITVWSVAKDGSLSVVPGSPFNSASGAGDLSGTSAVKRGKRVFLYVADFNGPLLGFEVTPTGSLVELPGSPFVGLVGPTGVAAVKDKLFVVDELASEVASFKIEKDGSLTPAPGSPVAPAAVEFIYSASPDRKAKFLYVADDGLSVHSFRIDKKSGALAEVTGSPVGVDFGLPASGASVSKRYIFVPEFEGFGVDVLAFRVDKKTGLPVELGSVESGLAISVHAFDPKGKFLVAASTPDALVRSFSVDKKTGFPDVVETDAVPGATRLTGIVIAK